MNWNGGARARARLNQFVPRGNVSRSTPNDAEFASDDEQEGNGGNNESQAPTERKRKRLAPPRSEFCPNVDYASMGYELVRREDPPRRRVVPLLEFVEKKFNRGHILSLHLTHIVDITRTPEEPTGSLNSGQVRIDSTSSSGTSTNDRRNESTSAQSSQDRLNREDSSIPIAPTSTSQSSDSRTSIHANGTSTRAQKSGDSEGTSSNSGRGWRSMPRLYCDDDQNDNDSFLMPPPTPNLHRSFPG